MEIFIKHNRLREVRDKKGYNYLPYNFSNFYNKETNNKKGTLDLYFLINKALENYKKEMSSFFKKEVNKIYRLLREEKDKYKKDKYSLSVSSYSEASECPVCKNKSLVKKEPSLFKCFMWCCIKASIGFNF
ncbi:MAG: hypothetical protein ABGW69_01660 [Nanoarchaeota archaeon]